MIEKINNFKIFDEFSDICALKIKALYKAYGFDYHFCSFYAQTVDDKLTAVISKFYGAATVSVLDSADLSEISDFLKILSVSEILAVKELTQFFSSDIKLVFSVSADCNGRETLEEIPDIKALIEVHRLFSQGDEDLNVGDFEDWYVDVNHRLRHNAASVVRSENTASLLLNDGENILLNGIATKKLERSKGEGSRMIEYIKNRKNAKKIYALCSEKLMPFYLKNGFEVIDEYSIIKL